MGARSFSKVPLQSCSAPAATFLLPFLYQTHRTQSASARSFLAQRSFLVNHPKRRCYSNNSNRSTDGVPLEKSLGKRQYSYEASSADAIPFEGDVGGLEGKQSAQGDAGGPFTQFAEGVSTRPPRASTITASEKAVFDRIFKEISTDSSRKAASDEDLLEDDLGDEAISTGDVYSDLNTIFDDALKQLKRQSEDDIEVQSAEKPSGFLSRNYITAIGPLFNAGAKYVNLAELRGGEDLKVIQKSVVEHRRHILNMLDEAGTDVEIWNVLEAEVFPLVQRYDTLIKEAEERDKANKPKRKRGRASKVDQEVAAAAEEKQKLLFKQKSRKEAETQAILSSNYGDYCLAAMRHLRRAFPTSPYCMNMLPVVKRLGPISHVLAASVDLYNEILFLQWKEYSDLHAMADLITEMGNQGIEANEVTLKVLSMVQNSRRNAIAQNLPMRLWWDLRPVWTGSLRLLSLAKKVHHEIMQARIRKAVEERESRSASEVDALLQDREDLSGEARAERQVRTKRALADEATILDGGLGNVSSQTTEV